MEPKIISKRQITMIKTFQRRLGIDDETYRETLKNRYQVESCTKLTAWQATRYIEELMKQVNPRPGRAGKAKRARQKTPKGVTALASQGQRRKILVLSRLVEWRIENGFDAWMTKRIGIDKVRTAADANRVIEGLKNMFENQMKAKHGPDWKSRRYGDQMIDGYLGHHGEGVANG